MRIVPLQRQKFFGEVYYAEQIHQKTPAAIKVFKTKLTPDKVRNFINEIRLVLLRHSHIVSILDFGIRGDDLGYLVMEYAPNGTLLAHHPEERGSLLLLL